MVSTSSVRRHEGSDAARSHHMAKKRITFVNGGNKVAKIFPPRKEEAKDFWFQPREGVVTKPFSFEVAPMDVVTIDIGLSVKLHSLAADFRDDAAPRPSGTHTFGSKSSYFRDRVALWISQHHGKKSQDWICCGSVGIGRVEKIHIVLPAGKYFLRTDSAVHLSVLGTAADVKQWLE